VTYRHFDTIATTHFYRVNSAGSFMPGTQRKMSSFSFPIAQDQCGGRIHDDECPPGPFGEWEGFTRSKTKNMTEGRKSSCFDDPSMPRAQHDGLSDLNMIKELLRSVPR